jgi:hypothetical protein
MCICPADVFSGKLQGNSYKKDWFEWYHYNSSPAFTVSGEGVETKSASDQAKLSKFRRNI